MLTFCIPIAPHHRELAQWAIASVKAQTVPCEVLTYYDDERRGAGVARNRLLEQVTTEFVSFLDADDWIEPTFTEALLKAWQPRHYVYCDWQVGKTIITAPGARAVWRDGTMNVITTVVNTQDARSVGGFDETLAGMEDTDFYLRLIYNCICPLYVNQTLFHYRPGGLRSLSIHDNNNAEKNKLDDLLRRRYTMAKTCCAGNKPINTAPTEQKQDGDILAMALWHGNRIEYGIATRRKYPRLSYPKTAWVAPIDVAKSPRLWRALEPMVEPAPLVAQVQRFVGAAGLGQAFEQAGIFHQSTPPVTHEPNPDMAALQRKLDQRRAREAAASADVGYKAHEELHDMAKAETDKGAERKAKAAAYMRERRAAKKVSGE